MPESNGQAGLGLRPNQKVQPARTGAQRKGGEVFPALEGMRGQVRYFRPKSNRIVDPSFKVI